ncbi:MAG TPA: hypothetical protein HPP81_04240 [Deltaproteobacteria bacterium]|jgi:hypothetical protein|nr:hypothetical protein [Deltaproteobacteria bacterium]
MSSVQDVIIVPVDSERDKADFLNLPWRIQRNDPCWVPPILSEQKKILDPLKGPFFEFGEARYFLAFHQGQPAGRLSAHTSRRYEARHDRETGFFGFFESVDDRRVAASLFDAAAAWLREKGKTRIQGPLSFTIYDEVGLLVEGFDSLPAFLQSHNPPYYQDLITSWGFRKAIDWYALRITKDRNADFAAMKRRLDQIMTGQGLVLTSPKPRDLVGRAEEVLEIFNESWDDNWGHIPLTKRQFQDVFKELRPLLRPELIDLIMDGDRIAAFLITIPDLNPSIQKLNGHLSVWSKLRLFYEARFKPARKLRALLLGVRKPYQRRQLHHALILSYIVRVTRLPSIELCDCSLIPEQLTFYLRTLKKYGAERYKTFRIFEREI